MTLTNALRSALSDPPDLASLRALGERRSADPVEVRQTIAGQVIRVALRDADYLVEHVPIMLDILKTAGASLADLARLMSEAHPTAPRSAEWVDAARRLAAWADGEVRKVTRIALVALDGSGVHGIGADLASAQAHALSTRDDDDPAWLDTLCAVTLSGEPAAVQALVEALSSLPAGGDVWEGT